MNTQSTRLQIALMRARCVAKRCTRRAVELLTAAGVDFNQAVRFVLAVLRSQRGAA